MAFIPAPNAVRLCLQFEWASQTVEICMGFLRNSAVALADMQNLVDDMEIWRQDELNPLLSNQLTSKQWYGTILTTSSSPTLIQPITVDTAGGVANVSVPNNVALVTTFQTALRGRSYRGRAYTPGVHTGMLASSTEVGPTAAALFTSAYGAINGAIDADWQHIVISYQNNGVMRTTAARTPVNGYRTEVRLDSQRRRLEGRGT